MESISQINEIESSIKVYLEIQVSWLDERLSFQKVRKGKLNLINSQKRQLWMPDIYFDNTHEKTKLILDDVATQAYVRILKDANGSMAPLTELYNSRTFSGKEG